MRRAWTWFLLVGALGAAVLLAFRMVREPTPGPEPTVPGAGPAGAREVGPSLVGTHDAAVELPVAAYTMHGRVHDPEGRGVPGVRVVARRSRDVAHDVPGLGHRLEECFRRAAGESRPAAETTTHEDGRFSLAGLDAGEGYWIHALPLPPLIGGARYAKSGQGRRGPVLLGVLGGHGLAVRTVDGTGDGLATEISALMTAGVLDSDSPAGRLRIDGLHTSSDGRLHIPALPPGLVLLDVRVPGRVRRYFRAAVPHAGELVLPLFEASGATVEGTVKNDEGNPIGGAEILVTVTSTRADEPPGAYGMATSAADGSWRVEGLPPVAFDGVVARAEGYLLAKRSGGNARLAAGVVRTVDLVLRRGTQLTGRVRGPGGEPLAGATVQVRTFTMGQGATFGPMTDGDGRFEVECLPPGAVTLNAYLDGWYQPNQSDGKVVGDRANEVRAVVGGAVQVQEIALLLLPGIPVGGRVIDSDGRPVAFAHVEAAEWPSPGTRPSKWIHHAALETTADPDGIFRFAGLAPGARWIFRAEAEGLQGSALLDKALAQEAVPQVEIRLASTASIAGRVLDESGASVPGVSVLVMGHGRPIQTDGAGAFAFQGLEAGVIHLHVRAPDGSLDLQEPRAVELAWGETRDDLVLEVPTPLSISGRLVDEAGEPVPHAALRVEREAGRNGTLAGATTTPDGRFAIRVWGSGPCRILHARALLRGGVEPPATGLRLVLPRDMHDVVTLRILDPDGEPVPRVRVILQSSTEGPSRRMVREVDDGVLVVPRDGLVAPVTVAIDRVRNALGRPANLLEQPRTVVDTAPYEIVIRLQRGRVLTGTVLTVAGDPVEGIYVGAGQSERRSKPRSGQTDAQGRFEIVALPDGELWAAPTTTGAHACWLPPATGAVAADQTEVHFRLSQGADLLVRLLDAEGNPIAGAALHVTAISGDVHWFRPGETDGAGECTIQGVAREARFHIKVTRGRAPAFPEALVEDVPYGTGEILIRTGVGVTIRGTVVDEEGHPVESALVTARSLGTPTTYAREQTGTESNVFTLGLVVPGRYELTAQAYGRYAMSLPVEVDAPARDVRLVLRRYHPLAGRIVGAGPEAALLMWWSDGSMTSGSPKKDGTFTFPRVTDESGTLTVMQLETGQSAMLEDVKPTDGPFTLRLQPGRTIAGRIEGYPGGEPRSVGLTFVRGPIRMGCGVQADSTFVQPCLGPGRWRLELRLGSEVVAVADDVEAGRTDVVLTLRGTKKGD